MFDKPKLLGVVADPDGLLEDAVRAVVQYDRASASLIQRRLSIGYARAARLIDQLESLGVITKSNGTSKPRAVLVKSYKEFEKKWGKLKTAEQEKDSPIPYVKYVPVMADFLPEKVKSLTNPTDLPLLGTDFSKIGNLIVTGNVISKKQEFIKLYLIFLLSKFDLNKIRLIIDDNTGTLNKFGSIPHLLATVINDTEKTVSALRWLLREMDRRIIKVNSGETEKFPVIVYIGNIFNIYNIEIEDAIKRLSSMGAHVGIHLILVGDRLGDFTKMIKDNIPARLDFDKYGEPEAVFLFKNKLKIKLDMLGENKVEKYLKSVK